jgi:hypothetical protein
VVLLMMATGGALVAMVHDHSRQGAILVAILLAAAWVAPLVALLSLMRPPREEGRARAGRGDL